MVNPLDVIDFGDLDMTRKGAPSGSAPAKSAGACLLKQQNIPMGNDDKHLTIHFNNGTAMQVSFPTQIKNSMAALMEAMKRLLESEKLVIQTEEQLIVVPWTSVKYVEASGVSGAALPLGAIKGARVLASDDKAAH